MGAENGPCATKLNNARGNQVTAAYVIKNSSQNYSWNISGSLAKLMTHGFSAKLGFNYGVSRSLVEPSSTAATSWAGTFQGVPGDPNNPPLAYSTNSPGKRIFVQASYSKQYFGFGTTTISMFYDGHTNGNASYTFSGDANGDVQTSNDLIYIPRNTSEMNFRPLTVSGRTYSPAEQAAAFEQLIKADSYLSSHRGEYAERGGVFLPVVNRIDLNISQDIFHSAKGARHTRPDSVGHHELRQPAELELGCGHSPYQRPGADEPPGRRQRSAQLHPPDAQRTTADDAAADQRRHQ